MEKPLSIEYRSDDVKLRYSIPLNEAFWEHVCEAAIVPRALQTLTNLIIWMNKLVKHKHRFLVTTLVYITTPD